MAECPGSWGNQSVRDIRRERETYLWEEKDHVSDSPYNPLRARDKTVKLRENIVSQCNLINRKLRALTFSSLALIRSSWMHLVMASVLLTTSS